MLPLEIVTWSRPFPVPGVLDDIYREAGIREIEIITDWRAFDPENPIGSANYFKFNQDRWDEKISLEDNLRIPEDLSTNGVPRGSTAWVCPDWEHFPASGYPILGPIEQPNTHLHAEVNNAMTQYGLGMQALRRHAPDCVPIAWDLTGQNPVTQIGGWRNMSQLLGYFDGVVIPHYLPGQPGDALADASRKLFWQNQRGWAQVHRIGRPTFRIGVAISMYRQTGEHKMTIAEQEEVVKIVATAVEAGQIDFIIHFVRARTDPPNPDLNEWNDLPDQIVWIKRLLDATAWNR